MTAITPETWARLGGETLQGRALRARQAAPDTTDRLLAALDADGQRHFLVFLRGDDPDLQDRQSRGIAVFTRELVMSNQDAGRYLDITCQDTAGHGAFDLIGGELAERLAAGRESAAEVVSRVLSKWRRFWGQLPRQMLSRDQQLGLFAELWFLSVWLVPRAGAIEAVRRWRGPFASRHDFEWPSRSVEVKATTSTRGRVHRINGLDQLEPPRPGELLLFSLRLREEAGATNTLSSIIATCRAQLQVDPDSLTQFEVALAQVGYSPTHDEEYAKVRLRIVDEGLFEVRDDFPRLTITQLTAGIPAGVERVEYEINLGGFDHLCVARRSIDAPKL